MDQMKNISDDWNKIDFQKEMDRTFRVLIWGCERIIEVAL
jgi:hypothetical protein